MARRWVQLQSSGGLPVAYLAAPAATPPSHTHCRHLDGAEDPLRPGMPSWIRPRPVRRLPVVYLCKFSTNKLMVLSILSFLVYYI